MLRTATTFRDDYLRLMVFSRSVDNRASLDGEIVVERVVEVIDPLTLTHQWNLLRSTLA